MTKIDLDNSVVAAKKYISEEFTFYSDEAKARVAAAYIQAAAIDRLADKIADGKITVNVAREALGLTPFVNHATFGA